MNDKKETTEYSFNEIIQNGYALSPRACKKAGHNGFYYSFSQVEKSPEKCFVSILHRSQGIREFIIKDRSTKEVSDYFKSCR